MLISGININAQGTKEILHEAMEQEISRNMKGLHLTGMKDPFYIGLNILDANRLTINSSLGTIISSSEVPFRTTSNLQVLVGDYSSSNLNYTRGILINSSALPIDNSTEEIRRKLWLLFDKAYKQSAEMYESKQSVLKSRTQSEDVAGLPDFLKGEKTVIEKPEISLKFENEKLTQYAREVSLALKSFKYLSASGVRIFGTKSNIYYSNSEGTKATYPASVVRLVIYVETKAGNGESIELFQTYYASDEKGLPPASEMIEDAGLMAVRLAELRDAPVFDDVYTGPVLFEGQAAAETMRKALFSSRGENLIAMRPPITGMITENVSSGDRIDEKISSANLIVKAKPAMLKYENIPLIGSYPVDMEGIVPPDEVILIENGVLKNLLCGRIPTLQMKNSNGHLRGMMGIPLTNIAPGVIEIDFKNGASRNELKKKLIKQAKSEGLEYALIVREVNPDMPEIKMVYKVDVRTGNEKLYRSAGFKGLALSDLRRLTAAGNQKIIFNATSSDFQMLKGDFLQGPPVTLITPDAFLYNAIGINKVNRTMTNKLPIVKNPLE